MMKKKFFISGLIAFTLGSPFSNSQITINTSKSFEIVYMADVKFAGNKQWLKTIRDDWKATAINLRIVKSNVEDANGNLNWNNPSYDINGTMRKIAEAGLNLYIRIVFTLNNRELVRKNFNKNDFHVRSNGVVFLNSYYKDNPLLNLTSKKSLQEMTSFLTNAVKYFNTLPQSVRSRIKLIVSVISPDDETELPFHTYDKSKQKVVHNILSGFSETEIEAFINFLKDRYGSIDKLNDSWGSEFTKLDKTEIQIRNYNWDGIKANPESIDYYKYEEGRKDFLDFRSKELKNFIDECSKIVKGKGYKFGIQFGSTYDNLVEFRGFYDPTPLVENADMLITSEVLEYYPNFKFSADYSRSLCNYWTWKNKSKEKKGFATETNWADYNNHKPVDLIKYWSNQLRTFYERGASCLFIAHWGSEVSPNQVSQRVLKKMELKDYSAWKDTLEKFQNVPVKEITSQYAYHIAPEQGLNYSFNESEYFIHNQGFIVDTLNGQNINEFPLKRFSYSPQRNDENIDYITSFMLRNSPDYAKTNYRKFYKTRSSKFMKDINKFDF